MPKLSLDSEILDHSHSQTENQLRISDETRSIDRSINRKDQFGMITANQSINQSFTIMQNSKKLKSFFPKNYLS